MYINNYEIGRYINNAVRSFSTEWNSIKHTDQFWDHRTFSTVKLRQDGCYVEWPKLRGRPRNVPEQYRFNLSDAKTISFYGGNEICNFRKKFGNNTKQINIKKSDTQEALMWITENVSKQQYTTINAYIGCNWELYYDDDSGIEADPSFDDINTVFIEHTEEYLEFVLRFGVCV